MIYVVWRPRSPAIGARIVDPYLLVDRQTQAAYYPQFIVRTNPLSLWHVPSVVGIGGNGTPHVSGWVVSVLCAWRCPAAYHVDFTIEQHTCHVALACGHRRARGVAVSTRVIDVNLIVPCADMGCNRRSCTPGR